MIRGQEIKNKETRYNPKNLHGYNKQVLEVETPVNLTKEKKREIRRERKEKKISRKPESTNVGHEPMEKLGWSSGTGQGKEEQGIVNPVESQR